MKHFMTIKTLLLALALAASSLIARPDVGFNDTDAYLEAVYDEENPANLKFKMSAAIANIDLQNTSYSLQALRDFAANFQFQTAALKEEIVFMLGAAGEDFGNSFQSALSSQTFLTELVRMLTAFDAMH